MSQPILIHSATVIRNSTPPEIADVLITEGKITEIARQIMPPEGTRKFDGTDKVLMPGMFDTQVHVREPGREDAETFQSAAAAALRSGITGFICLPDTHPVIDNGGMVQSVLDLASRTVLHREIFVAGSITKGLRGEELAEIGGMHERGVALITDDPAAVRNPLLMRRALQYARDLGLLVAAHCDIPELSGNGCMNDGRISYRLGLPGMPSCSEEICLVRDVRLAQSVHTNIHINQVTTRRGVETVARYKKEGMRVTAGVTPQHLIFCDEDVGDYDTNFKVQPPLRTHDDRMALIQGLRDGTLDLIATDHDPRTEFEKEGGFAAAPFGMIGLDTALAALNHYLIAKGELDWPTLVERFSKAPRRLVNQSVSVLEPGQRANCLLFNPAALTSVTRESLRSKSLNTPFLNQKLQGHVDLVILDGKILLDTSRS